MPLIRPKQIIYSYYPFTDQAGGKLRPCLVIAVNNDFVWALPITKIDSRGNYDEFIYQLSSSDTTSKLKFDSCVRCDIVMTIHIGTINKIVTVVNDEAYERIHELTSRVFISGKP